MTLIHQSQAWLCSCPLFHLVSLSHSFHAPTDAERIRGMKEPQEQKAAKDELRVLLRDCLEKIMACRYITLRRTETDIADVRELLAKAKAAREPPPKASRNEKP